MDHSFGEFVQRFNISLPSNEDEKLVVVSSHLLIPEQTIPVAFIFRAFLDKLVSKWMVNDEFGVNKKRKSDNDEMDSVGSSFDWINEASSVSAIMNRDESIICAFFQLVPLFKRLSNLLKQYFGIRKLFVEDSVRSQTNKTVLRVVLYALSELKFDWNLFFDPSCLFSFMNDSDPVIRISVRRILGRTWQMTDKEQTDWVEESHDYLSVYAADYKIKERNILLAEQIPLLGNVKNVSRQKRTCSFIFTQSFTQCINQIEAALALETPILVEGDHGCGKSSLIYALAELNFCKDSLLRIHMSEQLDSKALLGTYLCTDVPGEFEWKDGVVTLALLQGRWLLIEDIDLASMETISILLSIFNSRQVYIPSRGQTIKAKDSFKLFVTQRTIAKGKSSVFETMIGSRACYRLSMPSLSMDCANEILISLFPSIKDLVYKLIQVYYWISEYKYPGARKVTFKDVCKFAKRLESIGLGKLNDHLFVTVAFECFCAFLGKPEQRKKVAFDLLDHLDMPTELCTYVLEQSYPTQDVNEDRVRFGNGIVMRQKETLSLKKDPPFAYTQMSLRLLEKISLCIQLNEPLLLVGQTGCGKTTIVQHLANLTRQKLVVVNLNQQSESSDLVGGYKPVQLHEFAIPIVDEFEILFYKTYSKSKNSDFIHNVRKAFTKQKWQRLLALIKGALLKAKQKTSSQWDLFERKLVRFEIQVNRSKTHPFFFSFKEGALVQALTQGHWILLDELNLASSETLEILGSVLESVTGSIMLTERGDSETVSRHPNFRLIGCMNPADDVGKKDLPPSIRSFFTEIYVDEIDVLKSDVETLVRFYLNQFGCCTDRLTFDLVEFFYAVKKSSCLYDTANQKPHFSMRSLTRALSFAGTLMTTFGILRSIYEGICVSFTTQLNEESGVAMMDIIKQTLLSSVKNVPQFLRPPNIVQNDSVFSMNGFTIENGPFPCEEDLFFIITPTVEKHFFNLVRAIHSRKYPVLIQGDTSTGKTSMVRYLANKTGHKFVRINNHEHTDVQEYLGTYVTNDQGKIVFQEGILVEAVRKGYWIVLDELNLAPSDVLESLNRLLDDNRELFLPETQEVIKAHPHFLLFATQNPAGLYGGRKTLSKAFRNRFLEIHFDEIPSNEMETILSKKCELPPSFCKKMIQTYTELQEMRSCSKIFAGKHGFITLRDLFRWAERKPRTYDELGAIGYFLLGERIREEKEKMSVLQVIEKVMKVKIQLDIIYDVNQFQNEELKAHQGIVWTKAMQRLFYLVHSAVSNNEPVLLIGATGIGKTTLCQLIASLRKKKLHILNCHQHTETSDFIGSFRPCRSDSSKIFEWQDGSLIEAMKEGDFYLMDEISLAEDSVLERLNSVLEPQRSILLTEKGGNDDTIVAHEDFIFFATMNPGGDYGKKELSPALRNRFTEIWIPAVTDYDDIQMIVHSKLSASYLTKHMVDFVMWLKDEAAQELLFSFSLRDLISWCEFINVAPLSPEVAYLHGAFLVFIDGISSAVIKNQAYEKLVSPFPNLLIERSPCIGYIDGKFGSDPFFISVNGNVDMPLSFNFQSPSTNENAFRILRAMTLRKAILLEGSPGIGKTSLVSALAKCTNNKLVRINLSEQTDIMDLFGSDFPVEGSSSCEFAWKDGPFLAALKAGDWILLDELNLASQSVLEGLNACLDHRGTVFIPELGKTFKCSPHCRIFAAQNPMSEGGGRKGLAKSFVNRFTLVFLDCLTREDMLVIVRSLYPRIKDNLLNIAISFNDKMAKQQFFGGSKWEFNLRDVFRWLDLLEGEDSEPEDLAYYARVIYGDRLSTKEDKKKFNELVSSIAKISTNPKINIDITPETLTVGRVEANRVGNYCSDHEFKLLSCQLLPLENLLLCVKHDWLAILVGGPCTGKSSLVRFAASIMNQKLVHFSIHSGLDNSELLGGFEQMDVHRHVEQLFQQTEIVYCRWIKENFGRNVGGIVKLWHQLCHSQDKLNLLIQVLQRIDEHILLKRANELLKLKVKFEWVDGALIQAMENGSWIILENVNLCSPSVLDRLNSLFDSEKCLLVNECGQVDGDLRIVRKHPNFRIFMTMDPTYGEISRAMRNRGIEIYLSGSVYESDSWDRYRLVSDSFPLYEQAQEALSLVGKESINSQLLFNAIINGNHDHLHTRGHLHDVILPWNHPWFTSERNFLVATNCPRKSEDEYFHFLARAIMNHVSLDVLKMLIDKKYSVLIDQIMQVTSYETIVSILSSFHMSRQLETNSFHRAIVNGSFAKKEDMELFNVLNMALSAHKGNLETLCLVEILFGWIIGGFSKSLVAHWTDIAVQNKSLRLLVEPLKKMFQLKECHEFRQIWKSLYVPRRIIDPMVIKVIKKISSLFELVKIPFHDFGNTKLWATWLKRKNQLNGLFDNGVSLIKYCYANELKMEFSLEIIDKLIDEWSKTEECFLLDDGTELESLAFERPIVNCDLFLLSEVANHVREFKALKHDEIFKWKNHSNLSWLEAEPWLSYAETPTEYNKNAVWSCFMKRICLTKFKGSFGVEWLDGRVARKWIVDYISTKHAPLFLKSEKIELKMTELACDRSWLKLFSLSEAYEKLRLCFSVIEIDPNDKYIVKEICHKRLLEHQELCHSALNSDSLIRFGIPEEPHQLKSKTFKSFERNSEQLIRLRELLRQCQDIISTDKASTLESLVTLLSLAEQIGNDNDDLVQPFITCICNLILGLQMASSDDDEDENQKLIDLWKARIRPTECSIDNHRLFLLFVLRYQLLVGDLPISAQVFYNSCLPLHQEWMDEKEQKIADETSKNSMFKQKKQHLLTEEELEEEEIKKRFQVAELPRKDDDNDNQCLTRFIHSKLFGGESCEIAKIDSLISKFVVNDKSNLELLSMAFNGSTVHCDDDNYNFYSSPNVVQCERCLSPLKALHEKAKQLLYSWRDHAVLNDLIHLINRIVLFPRESPVMKFLTGLEMVLAKANEWESYASRLVSMKEEIEEISSLVLDWRRLEMNCWKGILDSVDNEYKESISEYWYHIFGLLKIDCNDDNNYKFQIVALLDQFLLTGKLGDYQYRVQMAHQFVVFMQQLDISQDVMRAFANTVSYYEFINQFTLKKIAAVRAPIEQELNDFIKITSWRDINYYALKESAQKSHKLLCKMIRKYKNGLEAPIVTIINELQVSSPTASYELTNNVLLVPAKPHEHFTKAVKYHDQVLSQVDKLLSNELFNEYIDSGIHRITELEKCNDLNIKRKAFSDLLKQLKWIGLSDRATSVMSEFKTGTFTIDCPILDHIKWNGIIENCNHYMLVAVYKRKKLLDTTWDPSIPSAKCIGLLEHLLLYLCEQKKMIFDLFELEKIINVVAGLERNGTRLDLATARKYMETMVLERNENIVFTLDPSIVIAWNKKLEFLQQYHPNPFILVKEIIGEQVNLDDTDDSVLLITQSLVKKVEKWIQLEQDDNLTKQMMPITLSHIKSIIETIQTDYSRYVNSNANSTLPCLLYFVQEFVDRLLHHHRLCAKFAAVLSGLFLELAMNGFCKGSDNSEGDNDGQGEQMADGTGLGQGRGDKDTSDKIENEDDLEGMQGEETEENGDEDDGNGVDMENDFDGEIEEEKKENLNESPNEENEEDDASQKDNEIGNTGDDAESKELDPSMWEDENDKVDDNQVEKVDEKELERMNEGERIDQGGEEGKEEEKEQEEMNLDNLDFDEDNDQNEELQNDEEMDVNDEKEANDEDEEMNTDDEKQTEEIQPNEEEDTNEMDLDVNEMETNEERDTNDEMDTNEADDMKHEEEPEETSEDIKPEKDDFHKTESKSDENANEFNANDNNSLSSHNNQGNQNDAIQDQQSNESANDLLMTNNCTQKYNNENVNKQTEITETVEKLMKSMSNILDEQAMETDKEEQEEDSGLLQLVDEQEKCQFALGISEENNMRDEFKREEETDKTKEKAKDSLEQSKESIKCEKETIKSDKEHLQSEQENIKSEENNLQSEKVESSEKGNITDVDDITVSKQETDDQIDIPCTFDDFDFNLNVSTESITDEDRKTWSNCESCTQPLAFELTEKLRLIIEPTLCTKLKGDYKSGKRLNMKKIIPFIASEFKKDKIWLRRTKPGKRDYRVLISMDDSDSMNHSSVVEMAFESLSLVAKSLDLLEIGQLGVVGFGETVSVLHSFNSAWTSDTGPSIVSHLKFDQRRTDMRSLLSCAKNLFESQAPCTSLWNLHIILSDGLCDDHSMLRSLVRESMEKSRILTVFVVLDNNYSKDSILKMKRVEYSTQGEMKFFKYMDTFPFDFYVVLQSVNDLPIVLADALRQWFEMTKYSE